MKEPELRKYKGKLVTVTLYNGREITGILEKDKSWWKIGKSGWFHYADIWRIEYEQNNLEQ